uniref:Uncharacterized protein n=1 Tax=Arundo donax TaxID=35708 RepID=A0A0A8Y6S6_ARUDO
MDWGSFEEEGLVFKQGSFPSLILLDLSCVFPFVKFADGTMPKLELLLIRGRAELQGLRYLTKLKEIRLDVPTSEEIKGNVQDQLAEHPNKDNISVTIK